MEGSTSHADRAEMRAALIGRQVGRYTIVKHLASGGMAEIYIARQRAVGGFEKQLVLKLLQGRYAENPRVVEMFLDEARLAAKLNHPSIVHVYDVAEADGVKFIAMEHIHGETLTDIIRRGVAVQNYLPLEHGLHIISQAAAGLAYAHGRFDADGAPLRIVHRDVSPSNILVSYEGQTKIVDFGIARIQDQIREESGMRPGKASYMSPEQVGGAGADYRSDIFSLGIILYEISLGQRLWRGPADEVMRRIVEETIPPPTSVRRDYPPALELIVMRALEKRPADRYQSAEEMRNDLEEFLDESGFRTGPRRMAIYLKQLFAPDAPVTEEGVAQARQLAEADSEPKVIAADESEELNFDRRASFSMRFEAAAPATPRQSPASALAAPLAFSALTLPPRTAEGGASGPSPSGQGEPGGDGAGLPPTSDSELPADLLPPEVRPARAVDALASAGGFPMAAAPPFGPKSLSAMAAGGPRAGSPSVWMILAIAVALTVILGVGAMVFIGLK